MVTPVKFRDIKKEIRIIGIDGHPFIPLDLEQVDLFGIVFRGGYWLDGVIRGKIDVNGLDATDKISDMIKTSPHYQQLRIIMLNGLTYAGFNTVNLRKLFEFTGLPILSITKEVPDINYLKQSLRNLPQGVKKWKDIEDAGEIIMLKKENSKIYMQIVGLLRENAEKIISISSTRSILPEPLRVAHIVASSLSKPLIE
jgi:endonuclease V-like protein UPF0215 family